MERLTFEGNFCDISQCIGEHRMTSMCADGDCDARKVWYRLKEYEETGLEPEMVKYMAENTETAVLAWVEEKYGLSVGELMDLIEAEKDGRLFISPVKVGDMLWPICWDGVTGEWYADDQPERVNEVGTKGFFLSAGIDEPEDIDEFYPYEMIGDEYFLSHEEAVAAAAVKEKPEVQE